MSDNANLIKAKKEKNDEFYTKLADIEKELEHYTTQLKDKVVYCNCDDYRESKFLGVFSRKLLQDRAKAPSSYSL